MHITLVVNHLNAELSPPILKNLKNVLRAAKADRDAQRQLQKVASNGT